MVIGLFCLVKIVARWFGPLGLSEIFRGSVWKILFLGLLLHPYSEIYINLLYRLKRLSSFLQSFPFVAVTVNCFESLQKLRLFILPSL